MVVLVARRGRPLPDEAEIHHFNGDRADNRRGNLVVCQDHSYHMLLQRRGRALRACGHADWLKCRHCGKYGDPATMNHSGTRLEHPGCGSAAHRRWRQRHLAQSQAYMREYSRGWRARNVEKRKAYQRAWYLRNRAPKEEK